MKHVINLEVFMLFLLVGLSFNHTCFAEDDSAADTPYKLYSEQLKDIVSSIRMPKVKMEITRLSSKENNLAKTEAIPFLIDVIQNGPSWSIEEYSSQRMNYARCYAVIALASTKDPQAYPILADLLQNGKSLFDPNSLEEKSRREKELRRRRSQGAYRGLNSEKNADSLAPYYIEIQKSQISDLRVSVVAGLGILGDDRATELLVTALDDDNPLVRKQCMLALSDIKDVRTIGPILDAASKYKLDQFAVNICIEKMTKVEIVTAIAKNEKHSITFPDFPELGTIQLIKGDPYIKAWRHWFKIAGKELTRKGFESKYNDWKKLKVKHSKEHDAVKYLKRKIAQLGIAALPYLIEKIEAGEIDLIDIVSGLTDGEVKREASKSEVLKWWEKNKEKWTIFPEKK